MGKTITKTKAEEALAEVIDMLYLQHKQNFCDYENKTHKLGWFKEQVKEKFRLRIISKIYDMKTH